MRRLEICAVALVLLAGACLGTGGADDERTVLVDFSHDEFASFFLENYPGEIDIVPGMTVVFKQTWTGEPHTITGGTLVDEMMRTGKPWLEFFSGFDELVAGGADLPNPEDPQGSAADFFEAIENAEDQRLAQQALDSYDALVEEGVDIPDRRKIGDTTFEEMVMAVDEESNKFFEGTKIPEAFGEDNLTQNAGQPCYLAEGSPPDDEDEACPKSKQRQPEFDGKATFYNSGIIPYEGPRGNRFEVTFADDIAPGAYNFFCAVHGVLQSTEVRVRPPGSDIPSQAEVSRTAREEIDELAGSMEKTFEDAQDGRIEVDGETVEGPFAGLPTQVHAGINEMVPKVIEAKVGEKVTWKIMGGDHSISFDVPEYFPIMKFSKGGKVALNEDMTEPKGGSPKVPEEDEEGEIKRVDGGTYDGNGFYSSSLFGAEPYAEYSLRFSKPGTYKYACLLHPPMVGTVEVT